MIESFQLNFRQNFALASYLTSISIIEERTDGTWNRNIAAGVKPHHFVLCHLVEGSMVLLIQLMEYAAYTVFFLSPNLSLNAGIIMLSLLVATGFTGLMFGLWLSIIAKTALESILVTQLFVYPTVFVSGKATSHFS